VCERWQTFTNFLEDMGERPEGMTIDRLDNTKGYSKENCRWATRKQQQLNRTNAVMLTYNGVTLNQTEWARKLGLKESAFRYRVASNFPPEKLFAASVRSELLQPVTGRRVNRRE
jgi:hypothetical protein